jgi:hypothetical protein
VCCTTSTPAADLDIGLLFDERGPLKPIHGRAKIPAEMLTEDDVVNAVCHHLEARGWRIDGRCSTNERGVDVVASNPATGATLRVEAKGETSAKPHTKRFGRPFDSAQVSSHVANAFYTAAATPPGERAAMAFPDTRLHREHVGTIAGAVQRLSIALFWVGADRSVIVESPWPL